MLYEIRDISNLFNWRMNKVYSMISFNWVFTFLIFYLNIQSPYFLFVKYTYSFFSFLQFSSLKIITFCWYVWFVSPFSYIIPECDVYCFDCCLRNDGMQQQCQNYSMICTYGVYIVVYCCCSLPFSHFTVDCWLYLFQYNPWIKHVPHLHNEMYIVILFWFATFWLIVVLKYNINQWAIKYIGVYHTISSATNNDHEPISLDTSGIN